VIGRREQGDRIVHGNQKKIRDERSIQVIPQEKKTERKSEGKERSKCQ